MVADTDILKELTLDELVQMQEVCKRNLPKAIRAHHHLYNSIRWACLYNTDELREQYILSEKCRIRFYGHRNGDINNCTHFGISGEKDYCIFAFTLQESCDEFRECLLKTKRIKWELKPLFISTEVQHLKELHRIFMVDVFFYIPNYMFFMAKEKALKLEWTVPDDVYIGDLDCKHVKQINDVWPHKYPGSDDFIATFIKANKGLGIFTKNENKLLSWVLINDNFCPGFLQTLDEAKRKGYAEILTKALLRYMAEEYNLDSTLFTIKTNTAGINLYKKLGLEIINSCAWVKIDTVSKLT